MPLKETSKLVNLNIKSLIAQTDKWGWPLPANPTEKLLLSEEPFTVYRSLTDLLAVPVTNSAVKEVRTKILHHPTTQLLLGLLTPWKSSVCKGHHRPSYPPNILKLLFDFGLTPGDHAAIKNTLSHMLEHQDSNGLFEGLIRPHGGKKEHDSGIWGSWACDHHIITEVLVRGGFAQNPSVKKAVKAIASTVEATFRGLGWKCSPHTRTGQRGPGRKDDVCPMVTIEALRLFAILPKTMRPKQGDLVQAGKTILSCWAQKNSKPYLFGHGRRFQNAKPPFLWYDIISVTDALSYYPGLHSEHSYQQMIQIIISNANPDGTYTPRSTYRLYAGTTFGQKKSWSPWTTLFCCRILNRSKDVLDNVAGAS
ncbi:MAG: hypothetical protein ACTSW4_03775 [Candidatus Ranarchaeia archaeon]